MAQRGHTNVDSFKDEAPVQVQNNFLGGLKTEFTGMNFPPNACTETNNVVFSLIGDVTRRKGINYENNFVYSQADRQDVAINTYHWLNAGGDGETQVLALQIGNTLHFYESSSATVLEPLSTTQLSSTINLTDFLVAQSTLDPSQIEAQFADGNGYLFVYHPYCDPFYCTFNNGTITATRINIKVRDFNGYPDGLATTARPGTLSNEHLYNLLNQGWTRGALWSTSTSIFDNHTAWDFDHAPLSFTGFGYTGAGPILGNHTWTVGANLPVTLGTQVDIIYQTTANVYDITIIQWAISPVTGTATGTVTAYDPATGIITIDITSVTPNLFSSDKEVSFNDVPGGDLNGFVPFYHGLSYYTISASVTVDLIDTWHTEVGNYPSNADVWWNFKTVETTVTNVSGGSVSTANAIFNPGTTINEVGLPSTPAPKGHFILDAFNQDQVTAANIPDLTPITTFTRPTTGTWFQGRVWYTGLNASQQATGDQNYYTWTENIYFSQIIDDPSKIGLCYQTNDPTDENLFALLPSDGGVVTIQGCGAIFKLFPIQNGMLVFAANGIWFITGSTGIGFTATDYTITKISNVRSISNNSYVNVNGMPMFWNEEGIYAIVSAQQGLGLNVDPVTVKTIRTFYNSIPRDSKKYARGIYDPINYVVQWIYRTTQEFDIISRYSFDSILCFNTATQAFYTYSISGTPSINAIDYISNPGGTNAPDPAIKYMASVLISGAFEYTFAEEKDAGYVDWYSYDTVGVTYDSHFVTGYGLSGQGLRLFQPGYINVYSRNIDSACGNGYIIQGLWNFGSDRNSGKWSSKQVSWTSLSDFSMFHRRHKIRGHGTVVQFKFSSYLNCPFDIMGWAVWETQNVGV